MTATTLRRLMRRSLDPQTLAAAEREQRIALQVLSYLVTHGIIKPVVGGAA